LLLSRGLVNLRGLRLGEAFWKSALASLAMGGAAWWLARELGALGTGGLLAQLLVAGGAGGLLYFGLCMLLHVEALDFFIAAVRRRMRPR
jgi:hypothetical protein